VEEKIGVEEKKRWVENLIKEFIKSSPDNSLKNNENDRAWDDPLVGFSNGSDPLYQSFKDMIGEFYWTPLEIFMESFPSIRVKPEDLTVISWILPQNELTKEDNRKENRYPSERWARSRLYGEEANVKLRRHVVESLRKEGIDAVAPMLSPLWRWRRSERFGLSSNWSERHAAYASGLGTFGLCDGLITPKGKAMRCGSVVALMKVNPTPRNYTNHNEYCLFFSEGICGKCIERCPAGAIDKNGHDKTKCLNYLREVTGDYVRKKFGLEIYGCGLCQTGVPCESKIPSRSDIQ
jgi:hypothetical protein